MKQDKKQKGRAAHPDRTGAGLQANGPGSGKGRTQINEQVASHGWRRLSHCVACCVSALCLTGRPSYAATVGTNSTVSISNTGTGTIALQGGTLEIDKTGTFSNSLTTAGSSTGTITSTIDTHGNTGTLSGVISDSASTSFPGALVINDSVGGGELVLTGSSTYSGATTINSSAMLALTGTGSIASSSVVTVNGTFDISQTSSGASIVSLSGAGSVALGSQTLTITNGSTTFTGVISGAGSLLISGGTQILDSTQAYTGNTVITRGTLQLGAGDSAGMILGNVVDAGTLTFDRADDITFGGVISGAGGVTLSGTGAVTFTQTETYTGATTISSGTLILASGASISGTSSVATDGAFDISATSGASIGSLSGSGTVSLGSAYLTLTNASGTFSGVISGSGGIILKSGTETLTGVNTYTGSTTILGGTLELGAATVSTNISDSGTLGFYSSGAIAMSGVVSGSGGLSQLGTGTTTLSAVQTYTGPTTISAGTLALSGAASIAASSNVEDDGTLSISAASSDVSITSLSGTGAVQLGSTNLILTNASGTFAGSITGTGNLTLAGGKETLSATSSFTGITTIAAGTLYITGADVLPDSAKIQDNATLDISGVVGSGTQTATAIVSLSGPGGVYLGAATLVLTDAADTFSGTISGTGGLTINAGTEVLTGANTYTGTTTINGGALVLQGSGSLASAGSVLDSGTFDISAVTTTGPVTIASLSGSGTVILGSNNLQLTAASDTFSGAITGAGGLIINGGTETLTGVSSYTGGTTIASGTLQIGNGITNGSIAGNVVDNGTLAFSQASTTTAIFSATVSGTGNLVQEGAGTVALTAANTYSGGTTISGGTLQIGNGGTSGSITGDVIDNGTLAFDRSDATTFSGAITGSGDVIQSGSSTLTLVAANAYTGMTTVNSGAVLALSGTGSVATSSDIAVNGTFDISQSNATVPITSLSGTGSVLLGSQTLQITGGANTFSGVISGSGGLIVSGGTETLAGTNSFTGATVINGGTLAVTGSIAASNGVTVNSGGTLSGSGSVSSVTVNSGATLAPTGTLLVNGNLSLASGSTYQVTLASATASKTVVSGSATVAGDISVVSSDGTYALGQKIAILTASGGLSGDFSLDPISSSGAQFKGTLSYDANTTYLEVDLAKLSPLLPGDATVNEKHVVGGIDKAIAAGITPSSGFQNLGNLSSAALAADADQLAGEIGTQVARAGNTLFSNITDTVQAHIGEMRQGLLSAKGPAAGQGQLWISGWTASGVTGGDLTGLGTHKSDTSTTGLVAGADWKLSDRLSLGGAVSYAHGKFDVAGDLGQGAADGLGVDGYGLIKFTPNTYGALIAGGALSQSTTSRTLTVSGEDELAGKTNTLVFGARYETGVSGRWFSPYIAAEDHVVHVPGYSETAVSGASTFALAYQSETMNFPDIEVGARQNADFSLNRNWMLSLSDRLAWLDNMAGRSKANAAFSDVSSSDFTVLGASPADDAALIGLGAELRSRFGLALDLHVSSTVTSRSQSYTGIGGVSVQW